MQVRESYNQWAAQYDTHTNKTRDLEAKALREILGGIGIKKCLEIGCGTGKNTEWIARRATSVTAVDLSEAMLARAKEKLQDTNIQFIQADITTPWNFTDGTYDLVSFSLVLEHIEDLFPVLEKAAAVLSPGGYIYVGELHPFKQYAGSKARFETDEGTQVVTCYNHHLCDFTAAARAFGLQVDELREYFDEDDRTQMPRILCLLFKKEGV